MEGSHGENLICSKHLSAEWLSEGQGHRYVPFVFGVSVEKLGASRDHLVSSACDQEKRRVLLSLTLAATISHLLVHSTLQYIKLLPSSPFFLNLHNLET